MNKDETIKVLVLGANGFIGSHLVDRLVDQGFHVRAFDRFSRPPQFMQGNTVTQVKGDIFDENDIAASLADVTYVFHAFSATTPYSSDLDPYSDVHKNILNNVKIFELCVKQQISKLVYMSSGGAIYGETAENGSVAAEVDVALPVSPYGISKLASERYLAYFAKKFGLKHVSYRLSNPYGPRQITKHNQGVIPKFISNIIQDEPITLYGDGTASRDYIYIKDAVNMVVQSFEHCQYDVYNIGSGQQTELRALVDILEAQLDKKAIVENLPQPATFVESSELDVSRFSQEFSFGPSVNLSTGIAKTVKG